MKNNVWGLLMQLMMLLLSHPRSSYTMPPFIRPSSTSSSLTFVSRKSSRRIRPSSTQLHSFGNPMGINNAARYIHASSISKQPNRHAPEREATPAKVVAAVEETSKQAASGEFVSRDTMFRIGKGSALLLLLKGLKDALYPPAEAVLERTVTHAVENAIEHAVEREATKQAAGLMSRETMIRFGKGCLAIIPALGALFALYLSKHDLKRAQQEWNDHDTASSLLFFGAGVADILDAAIHFWISYILFCHLSGGGNVETIEELSSQCVLTSAICIAFGELISFQFHQNDDDKQQQARHKESLKKHH